MSVSENPGLAGHPLFGNRKRVLATPATKSKNPENKRAKAIITFSFLGLLLIAAFITGLWAYNPDGGIGAALVSLPGNIWQQLMQMQLGEQAGSALAQQSPWALARVGGIMAYVMSFLSVTLGLMMTLRWRWVRNILHPTNTFYLHKILALLTMFFLGMHLAGLALDSYVHISLLQILVPFSTGSYRPLWTGLGTIALYSTVLVSVTAYPARKLGYKVWRTVHYLTFGIFGLSLLHGIMAGSDTGSIWMQLVYLFSGLVVAALVAMRFVKKPVAAKVA